MRSQKIINLLDNEIAQPSKFRTKNWVQINDDVCGTYSVNSHLNLLLHCQNKVYAITVISEEEAAIITGEGASRADEVKKN